MSAEPVTWVVGAGGLLGSHLVRRLDADGASTMTATIPWCDEEASLAALADGFASLLAAAAGGPWNVAWCAGVGVPSTPADELARERRVFSRFLDHVREQLDGVEPARDGAFFLASSAGGVYARSAEPPFTETTQDGPAAAYGLMKLGMEHDLRAFAHGTGVPVLVGRIANLYGPGQNLDKPQGLVSQLCKAHLARQPLRIYVPLDTRRDYLFVEDCAAMIAGGLQGLRDRVGGSAETPVVTKILASGQSTTIAALIGEATRMFRRRPPVVVGETPDASAQVLDLSFSSQVWTELDRLVTTSLPVGLAATARDVSRRLTRSQVG